MSDINSSVKLYITLTSPYARLARMVVLEKDLGDKVEQIIAKTRQVDSPFYQVNPSGRVPCLILPEEPYKPRAAFGKSPRSPVP